MLIGLDYDKTFTAAPGLFCQFVGMCKALKYSVVIVTGRDQEHNAIDDSRVTVPIIYCDGRLKREAAEDAGYLVDIWIDDEPGTIEPCRVLEWEDGR